MIVPITGIPSLGLAYHAANAGSTKTAVAVRVLCKVLLVVILGIVEGIERQYFGRDLGVACVRKTILVSLQRLLRQCSLRLITREDYRSILCADVISLAHSLGWVVAFPKYAQHIAVTGHTRVEHDQHYLGMPGRSGTDLRIIRIRRRAAGIPCGSRVNARGFPEVTLRTPKATQREYGLLQVLIERTSQAGSVYKVRFNNSWPQSFPFFPAVLRNASRSD